MPRINVLEVIQSMTMARKLLEAEFPVLAFFPEQASLVVREFMIAESTAAVLKKAAMLADPANMHDRMKIAACFYACFRQQI